MHTLLALSAVGIAGFAFGYAAREWEVRRSRTFEEIRPTPIRCMTEIRVAYHEAGHTVVARLSPHTTHIMQATIDHGSIGFGHVQYSRSGGDDPSALWAELATRLAGIASEMIEFRRVRSGSSKDDLERALATARKLIEISGPEADPPWKGDLPDESTFDVSRMFASIGSAEGRVLRIAYARARALLLRNEALVDKVSEALLAKGTLEEDDLKALFRR